MDSQEILARTQIIEAMDNARRQLSVGEMSLLQQSVRHAIDNMNILPASGANLRDLETTSASNIIWGALTNMRFVREVAGVQL